MKGVFLALVLALTCISALAEQIVVVTAEKLNVRAAPSTEAAIVDQVERGDRLTVIPVSESWAKVVLPAGNENFVSRRYLKLTDTSVRTQTIKEGIGGLFAALIVIAFLFTALWVFVRACQWMSRKGHPVLGFFVNLVLAGSGFGWILLLIMAMQTRKTRPAGIETAP